MSVQTSRFAKNCWSKIKQISVIHSLEVLGCGDEIQLQVGEYLNLNVAL